MDSPPVCQNISVSYTSLISALNQAFNHSEFRSLRIDSSTCITLRPVLEPGFISSIWQHGFRREEDQLLMVVPTHLASSTPFFSAVSQFPGVVPEVLQALNVLMPFLTALTPENLSQRFHNGIQVSFSLNSSGELLSTRLYLSNDPVRTFDQLLNLPRKHDNRVFDAFYYMLLSQKDHAEFLSLKGSKQDYDLLSPSGTYRLPEWVQISDDDALAQDWYDSLQQCGFKGSALRGIMATLSGILLLGNSSNPSDLADGASLLGLDPDLLRSKYHPHQVIVSSYKLLLKNILGQLNTFLAGFDILPEELASPEDAEVVSVVNVVECPSSPLVKYNVLKNVFDDHTGINSEMLEDGLILPKTPKPVSKALKKLQSVTLVPSSGYNDIPNLQSLMDKEISYLAKEIKSPAPPDLVQQQPDSRFMDAVFDLPSLMDSYRIWTVLSVSPFHNAQAEFRDEWTGNIISSQIREYFLKEWADKRRAIDFTADFENYEFLQRYSALIPPNVGIFQLEDWVRLNKQWSPGQFFFGNKHLWVAEEIWLELEEALSDPTANMENNNNLINMNDGFYDEEYHPVAFQPSGVLKSIGHNPYSRDGAAVGTAAADTSEETAIPSAESDSDDELEMDYLLERYNNKDAEFLGSGAEKTFKTEKMSPDRRFWVSFVWALTFWIPSPLLKLFGMSRPDVRMAWREKLAICFLIFLINAGIIFYMIFLGDFVCTDYDKVWNAKEVSYHQGTDDYYVSLHGNVYDLTKFYTKQHSDNGIKTTSALMMEFAGTDVSDYFPPPLTIACPNLVTDKSIKLSINSTKSPLISVASHESGSYFVPSTTTKLHNYTWYNDVFKPSIKNYYKGRLVTTKKALTKLYEKEAVYTFILDGEIYDVTNYFLTISDHPESDGSTNDYNFFDSNMVDLFETAYGGDISKKFYSSTFSDSTRADTLTCLKNAFAAGKVDFRESARCQAANYVLLIMAGILTSITVVKFLASLRIGGKARPVAQDKFVICQIPAYTEDEDALRLSIDSLTDLDYDNRRKLLLIICDGMIIGSGNDKATPNIVLDLLGVNHKIVPPSLFYHSVGEGADQVNCAKVYSGLYEHDGNVVPFMVIVKVGRPDEKGMQKPGNRGKRDSQILVLDFLNRVHYQKPMSPLHLEMFHHLNNIIGVDPELYEYLFMVDADTAVAEDALTRLVAHCANDTRVAGTCGETNLQNENKSLATMIQVYEYFISHHLTKAFESLFGSVTCLPGCFSLYRLRGTKKQKPLIMSNEVIREYSINNIDTLHKKNLFSLGEDRYLTTLMAKHFPKMKFTFVGDAKCYTEAPEEFSVLLSQRRRWINSTVHNLVELLKLKSMCGFCLVGMRGVVFVDLIGTIMLPAVVFYLGYLLYRIISGNGPLPIISIILIAAVYGLQTLVYILRRQWQHIGWMLIYILAYPIHSFLLPIYSFWNMDNFTWGNTRKVLEMKDGKQFVEEKVPVVGPDEIEMETWNSYAVRNGLPGAERRIVFDDSKGKMFFDVNEDMYDMADMRHVRAEMAAESMYSKNVHGAESGGMGRRSSIASTAQMSQVFGNNNNRMSRLSFAPTELGNNDFDEDYELQVRSSIKDVLHTADLDTMTKRQLRQRVEDILGIEFIGEKIVTVDRMIDEELELLDLDDGSSDEAQESGNGIQDKSHQENDDIDHRRAP